MKTLIRAFFRLVRLLLAPFMLLWAAWPVRREASRSPEAEQRLQAALEGMSLYHFPTCPFCIRTRRALRRMGIDLPLRDALHDPQAREELEQGGGRIQVPCLRIPDANGKDRWLYESDDIIAYLSRLAREAEQPETRKAA
ncbi:MAG: glutaredoxin [Gammaproteobacteria bacterium]|nr:MAG: glutaredoxin [Gammaproteobacteria bacterium]